MALDPLHWQVRITNPDGTPTNEFLRQWNEQRVINAAASGGGGASDFLGLSDTPSSYSGAALKVVRVNAGETDLEFGVVLGTMAQAATADYTPTSGLGTMAFEDAADYVLGSDFATFVGTLATVAFSGDYGDLANTPTLGTMAAEDASDYTPTVGLGDLAFEDDAAGVPYDNMTSGLAATDVQAAIDEVVAASAYRFPRGYINRLTISNNVTDATNDIDTTAGECRDSTDTLNITPGALTKRLDATYAAGTGNGGRFDTSISDGTWHVFAIGNGTTNDIGLSKSLNPSGEPNFPSGYSYRRIGSIVRVSGAVKAFVQDGDRFSWAAPVADVSVANPGTSAVTRTLTVPTGIRVEAVLSVGGGGLSATTESPQGVLISDLAVPDAAPNSANFTFYADIGSAVIFVLGVSQVRCFTNTSGQVRSRLQRSATNTTLFINTYGWIDTRGRFE